MEYAIDEVCRLVEIAEESALSELGAFGSAEPWFYGEPEQSAYGARFSKTVWSDERCLVGEEWDAWDAATEDIPERFFELDWSMGWSGGSSSPWESRSQERSSQELREE